MLDRDIVPVKTSCVTSQRLYVFSLSQASCVVSILMMLKFCSSRRWKSEIEPQKPLLYMRQMNADNAILSTMLVKSE